MPNLPKKAMTITADTITIPGIEKINAACLAAYQKTRRLAFEVHLGNMTTEEAANRLREILLPLQMEVEP